jgi:hypothetical protein
MKYEFRGPARAGRCWLPAEAKFEEYERQCSDGEIVVWGDSLSALLATGIPKPYAQFSRDGWEPLLTGGADPCAKSNALITDEILRQKPRRVVLFGYWLGTIPNWQVDSKLVEPLRHTLQKLRSDIDDVVLVGPTPTFPPSLPAVVFKFWSDFGMLPDRLKVSPENYHATDEVLRSIAKAEGVRFVSAYDALCNTDGCVTHTPASRSELLMWDSAHMTLEGAAYVVQLLGLAQ